MPVDTSESDVQSNDETGDSDPDLRTDDSDEQGPDEPGGQEDGAGAGPGMEEDPGLRTGDDLPPYEPGGPVGTEMAYRDLIEEAEELLDPDQLADVPWPDLRNGDASEAYLSAGRFLDWAWQNNVDPGLVQVFAEPGGPTHRDFTDYFVSASERQVLYSAPVPPYSVDIRTVGVIGDWELPSWIDTEVLPAGSVAIGYFDSLGARDEIDQRSGDPVGRSEGWSQRGPWIAILVPTEVGWRIWIDEEIDAIPGDNQGRSESEQPSINV